MLILKKPSLEEALSIQLPPQQLLEIKRSHTGTASDVIESCYNKSVEVLSVVGKEVECLAGVIPFNLLNGVVNIWLLTTGRHPKTLLKYTKIVLPYWKSKWSYIFNFVDAEYEEALRWAKWAGFDISEPVPYGPEGKPFCLIKIGN